MTTLPHESTDSTIQDGSLLVQEGVKIKEEMETLLEPSMENKNFDIKVKEELEFEDSILPETKFKTFHTVKIENNIHIDEDHMLQEFSESYDTKGEVSNVKIEPKFDVSEEGNDDRSMDSSDAVALGNVETYLQDELDIKIENDAAEEYKNTFNIDIKQEMIPSVTETHLISNKLISTTSTVTNPQHGYIESQTTNTLVMEILPISQKGNISLTVMRCDPEEILSTPFCGKETRDDHSGYLPPVEDDNDGQDLIDEYESKSQVDSKDIKIKEEIQYPCPKCIKICKTKSQYESHLRVHDTIENRILGAIKSKETRKYNQEQRLNKSLLERRNEFKTKRERKKVRKECKYVKIKKLEGNPMKVTKKSRELKRLVEDGTYVCTCGQVFRRKTALEACFRTHNDNASTSSYNCLSCSKQYGDMNQLSQHRKRAHRKRFQCKFCPTDYQTKKDLFRHLQLHQKVQLTEFKVISKVMNGDKELKCLLCLKLFKEIAELKSHALDHTAPYSCTICKNTFEKFVDFKSHMKSFHPDIDGLLVLDVIEAFSKLVKAWKCDDCGVQFNEADKLAWHQVDAHSSEIKTELQHQCTDCRRVFVSQKGLLSHKRIHDVDPVEETEPEGIMCLECRKMCKDMTHLTSHMRLHSEDRKYRCKYCDFRFATPESRKTHAEIHTGDMKFVCFICDYQCTSESRLKGHKASLKHLNMKEFLLTGKPLIEEPTDKSRDTSKKKRKKSNIDSEIDNYVACDVCGDKFPNEELMLEHKQTHPFIEFPNEDKPTRIFFK